MMKQIRTILLLASIMVVRGQDGITFDNFLTTNVDSLDFKSDSPAQSLTVALKERPDSEVMVYMQAPNTKFDKCALKFTPDDYNKAQDLQVVQVPIMTGQTTPVDVPIRFTSYAVDWKSKFHNRNHRINTKRVPMKNGLCEVQGDPHYKAFNQEQLLEFQGVGDFYLVKSAALTIQSRQVNCVYNASCVNMLAVRYGTSSFIVDANEDDPSKSIKQVSNDLNGVVISRTRSGTQIILEVAFNAGSSMKVIVWSYESHRLITVTISLNQYLVGKVNGLCGRFEENGKPSFTGPNGEVFDTQGLINQGKEDWTNKSPKFMNSPLYQFGEQWRVPDTDNIFKCRNNCPGAPNPETPVKEPVAECKIPSPPTPPTSTSTTTTTTTTSSTTIITSLSTSSTSLSTQGSLNSATNSVPSATALATNINTTSQSQTVSPSGSVYATSTTAVITSSTSASALSTFLTNGNNGPTTTSVPMGCPTPIVMIPIPVGYKQVVTLPKYSEEPRALPPAKLPPAPRSEINKAKEECARQITPIELCDVNIKRYIDSCVADVELQMNPNLVYETYRFAYTSVCSRMILDKTRFTSDMDVARRALDVAKKCRFGNIRCDDQCLQCSQQGCLECKNRDLYEVQAGKCVPKPRILPFNPIYFTPNPVYYKLKPEELAKSDLDPRDITFGTDIRTNPNAMVKSDSVENALSNRLGGIRDFLKDKKVGDLINDALNKLKGSNASHVYVSSATITMMILSIYLLI